MSQQKYSVQSWDFTAAERFLLGHSKNDKTMAKMVQTLYTVQCQIWLIDDIYILSCICVYSHSK